MYITKFHEAIIEKILLSIHTDTKLIKNCATKIHKKLNGRYNRKLNAHKADSNIIAKQFG